MMGAPRRCDKAAAPRPADADYPAVAFRRLPRREAGRPPRPRPMRFAKAERARA